MPLDSPLVQSARELARTAHRDQRRKASGDPYFSHLQGVAEILVSHDYSGDVELAAAYLHDLLEDQPASADAMFASMPESVVGIVRLLSEKKLDDHGNKRPKAERFVDYVAGLAVHSPLACQAIPISCADRIHNTRSIVEDERRGFSPFMHLATRPGELLRQLDTLRKVYEPIVTSRLLETFDKARAELEHTIERWLPGRAVMIAAQAHLGQFDKAGQPYILHPMRLALAAASNAERVVAMLHDVIEDSSVTLNDLEREGFHESTLRALSLLTKREGEGYEEFIRRVARDRLATKVKLLDLADNSDLTRLERVTDKDRARVEKYQRASAVLQAELRKRSLYIVLDAASRQRLLELATLPILRGHHVTLAYRVDPAQFQPSWVPGGHAVGSTVAITATQLVRTEEVEVLVIECAGDSQRPQDGGTLHVTLSRRPGARSRDANRALEVGSRTAVSLELSGTIEWAVG